MADSDEPVVPVDIWRDSPVRFLGYANELGESFRPIVPRLVAPSYALAFAYVLGDTAHKTTRAVANAPSDAARTSHGAAAALDTLIWQTLVRYWRWHDALWGCWLCRYTENDELLPGTGERRDSGLHHQPCGACCL